MGGNYTSTIVPVPTTVSLSSIWGTPGVPHEMYAVSSVSLLTAPFNIDDLLQTPVPYSIYSSQPWCASELFWGQLDTTDTTTFECATTAPYKPIIVAPGEFLAKIDPAFASCSPEVKGFYDPVSLRVAAFVMSFKRFADCLPFPHAAESPEENGRRGRSDYSYSCRPRTHHASPDGSGVYYSCA